jgi:beta-glucosidase
MFSRSLNGVPTCGSPGLLNTILRDQWKFDGFVVSDYDAWASMLNNLYHHVASMVDVAAEGLNAGLDQEGGGDKAISQLPAAIGAGKTTVEKVQTALRRLFRVRIRLGMLDPPNTVPYDRITASTLQSAPHMPAGPSTQVF